MGPGVQWPELRVPPHAKKIPSSLSPESSFEKRVVVITTAGCHQSLPEGWLHVVLGSWGVLGKH